MNRHLLTLMATLAGVAPATSGTAVADGYFSNSAALPVTGIPTSSAINVAGQSGRVTKATVSLYGVSHSETRDLDVLLVSPDGRHTLVMSEACTGHTTRWSWTFDDDAPSRLGIVTDDCGGLFYRPTDVNTYASTDVFLGAPAGPYSAHLSNLIGAQPNGEWRLYVSDEQPSQNDGVIASGWSVSLETSPAVATVPGAASGAADTYPLTHELSGLDGVIEDVDVTLPEVHHGNSGHLLLMLVGPRGQRVILKGGECAGTAARGRTWTFNDEAPGPMSASAGCPTGSYRVPTGEPLPLPAPAPAPGIDRALSAFDGSDPNGTWRLYAADIEPLKESGLLGLPFQLKVKNRPRATARITPAALTLSEGGSSRLTVTREAPGGQELGQGAVTVTTVGQSATPGDDFTPVMTTLEFAAGQATRTMPITALTDARAEADESFRVVLSYPTGDAAIETKNAATVTIAEAPASEPAPGTGDQPPTGGETPGSPGDQQPRSTEQTGQVDRTAPAITGVRLSANRLTAGRKTTATLRFALSEPAAVTIALLGTRGRTVATLRHVGKSGANRVAVSGRVNGVTLRPGRYRLVVQATDAAGNRSSARPRALRIVKAAAGH